MNHRAGRRENTENVLLASILVTHYKGMQLSKYVHWEVKPRGTQWDFLTSRFAQSRRGSVLAQSDWCPRGLVNAFGIAALIRSKTRSRGRASQYDRRQVLSDSPKLMPKLVLRPGSFSPAIRRRQRRVAGLRRSFVYRRQSRSAGPRPPRLAARASPAGAPSHSWPRTGPLSSWWTPTATRRRSPACRRQEVGESGVPPQGQEDDRAPDGHFPRAPQPQRHGH